MDRQDELCRFGAEHPGHLHRGGSHRPGRVSTLDQLASIPEEEIRLSKQKSARTRRAYRLDVQHFVRTLGIRTPAELRQADHKAVIAWERYSPYRIPAYRAVCHFRLTNKTPAATYRAPGRYEGTFVRERLLDAVADRLQRGVMSQRFGNSRMADVEGAAADAVRRHRPDALGDDLLLALGDVSLTPAIKAVLGLGATEQPPVPRMKVSMRPIFISGLHGCPGRHSTGAGSVSNALRMARARVGS
jgi:Molybdopterin-binding domain of aldehyde dehydrogenase